MKKPEDLFFDKLHTAILAQDPRAKCAATNEAAEKLKTLSNLPILGLKENTAQAIPTPGLPEHLELVSPRELKRRGIAQQTGRNVLMHAIAHIEFNAINLALDAAYRFRGLTFQFYKDWMDVAKDEARHFQLINQYLRENGREYGDFPAHNGLWDMAVETDHDVLARMALVPRVMEARGLDVTPSMIKRLKSVGDQSAVDILTTIYQDEIQHVAIGSKWYHYFCDLQNLEPRATFRRLVDKHLHGGIRGPLNISARLMAGFDAEELEGLESGG